MRYRVRCKQVVLLIFVTALAQACAAVDSNSPCLDIRPCEPRKPDCKISDTGPNNICCAESCETCGGDACSRTNADPDNCCPFEIAQKGKLCADPPEGPCIWNQPDILVNVEGSGSSCKPMLVPQVDSPNCKSITADGDICNKNDKDLFVLFGKDSEVNEFDWQIVAALENRQDDSGPCESTSGRCTRGPAPGSENIFNKPVGPLRAFLKQDQSEFLLIDNVSGQRDIGIFCYWLGVIASSCCESFTIWSDPKIYNKNPTTPPGQGWSGAGQNQR